MKEENQKDFATLILSRPWLVILVVGVIMAFLGSFMTQVQPSVSFTDLLGEGWEGLEDYDYLQTEYAPDDTSLVMIEAKSGDAFTPEILSKVHELTAILWKTPHSIRVDSVTNFQHTTAMGDNLDVGDLVPNPAALSASEIVRIREIAINDPLALHRVVNPEGNVLAIIVTFLFPNVGPAEKLESHDYVEAAVAKYRTQMPDANIYVGGLTALDATVLKLSMKETGLFLGLVLSISVVLLIFLLRSIVPIICSVAVLLMSVVAAMSLAGMFGWKLTPFTSTVPMMVLMIGIADCVHLLTGYMQFLRSGDSRDSALLKTLRANSKPIIITSVTTAIGFLTFNLSGSLSITALGNQAAFGVMTACILSISFLPAMLKVLPFKSPSAVEKSSIYFQRWVRFITMYRYPILGVSLITIFVVSPMALRNEFNDRVPTYFAESLPWRQANDFGEEHFGSAYTFSFSVHSGTEGGISDPKYLNEVENFAEYLRGIPKVSYVKSITDTFKRLNRNMHADDDAHYVLPADKNTAAQYLLLYEMSLPYGLDLTDQINFDKSATKVTAAFQSMSVSEVLAMEDQITSWMAENISAADHRHSGAQLMFAHLMNQDTRGLTLGAIYGLVLISFLLIFMLGSFRVGVISLLPNLVPIVIAFGFWGLFIGQVGFGLAMVSGMSIGIIVDDTVHFLNKYLYGRNKLGLDAAKSVEYAFVNVGRSIMFTTFVLVVGFLVMVTVSEFRVNTDMGKMTSLILILALVFDFVTLPVLLLVFDSKPGKTNAPTTA